ncbi:MAG: B12-binding domain-containing radical SAM protein [Candidatus Helarchaeota archaeon]|nr:B12-binding domain-containing radical SAM protein [Candidatus Helarchaeota archaeon]
MVDVFLTSDKAAFPKPDIGFFLPSFFPGAPWGQIPKIGQIALERIMFSKVSEKNGIVHECFYGLRKFEAVLLGAGIDCAVFSPYVIGKYAEDAKVFCVSAMDPLALGPVSVTSMGLFGNKEYNLTGNPDSFKPPLSMIKFKELIEELKQFEKPIIVGGSGANQFELLPQEIDNLGIDCVFVGDAEIEGPPLIKKALRKEKLPKIVKAKNIPKDIEIPTIVNPVSWGLVEISRGCDRHCRFCDPSIREFRWIPVENIVKEIKVNLRMCKNITLMSEDVFRYGTKQRQWVPDWGLVNLVKEVKKIPGVATVGLSHACIASALAAPEQIESLRDELNLTKQHYSSVQVGVETGSIRLVAKYMPFKGAPFEADDWPELVLDGWKLLCRNHIYPAGTLMVGLDDTDEDIQTTINLVKKLNKYPGMCWPLTFMPLGALRSKKRENFYTDWTVMSPKTRELFLLCINHMLDQSEKMDEHIFGTQFHRRVLNHLGALFGRVIVRSIETEAYQKGKHDYLKMGRIALKELVHYVSDYIRRRGEKARFYEEARS